MSWSNFANKTLSNSWTYTDPVEGSIFRVTHIIDPVVSYKGLICQAFFGDSGTELHDIRSIYSKGESDLIEMICPPGLVNRRIAIRRTDRYANPWNVSIDVADPVMPTIPIGTVTQFAGLVAPDGWLMCDGSAISRTTYADLFNTVGVAYGAGDGTNTFNLPDFRGRAVVGAGQGTGLTNRSLGSQFGSETRVITPQNIAWGTSTAFLLARPNTGGSFLLALGGGTPNTVLLSVPSTGSQQNLDVFQPSLSINHIVKY